MFVPSWAPRNLAQIVQCQDEQGAHGEQERRQARYPQISYQSQLRASEMRLVDMKQYYSSTILGILLFYSSIQPSLII